MKALRSTSLLLLLQRVTVVDLYMEHKVGANVSPMVDENTPAILSMLSAAMLYGIGWCLVCTLPFSPFVSSHTKEKCMFMKKLYSVLYILLSR